MNISENLPVELENYDNLYWYFTTYIHESHTGRYQKELSTGEMGLNGNKKKHIQPDDKDKLMYYSSHQIKAVSHIIHGTWTESHFKTSKIK